MSTVKQKRAREFLTPEVRRTLIMAALMAALMAAGHEPFIAGRTAHRVDATLLLNGVRNRRALAEAITTQLFLAMPIERRIGARQRHRRRQLLSRVGYA